MDLCILISHIFQIFIQLCCILGDFFPKSSSFITFLQLLYHKPLRFLNINFVYFIYRVFSNLAGNYNSPLLFYFFERNIYIYFISCIWSLKYLKFLRVWLHFIFLSCWLLHLGRWFSYINYEFWLWSNFCLRGIAKRPIFSHERFPFDFYCCLGHQVPRSALNWNSCLVPFWTIHIHAGTKPRCHKSSGRYYCCC